MDQLLEQLFGSLPKVRILRLFMQNPEEYFTFKEIAERTKLSPRVSKKELHKLMKIDLIREKNINIREEIRQKKVVPRKPAYKKKIRSKIKKTRVFYLNSEFPFLKELKDLVIKASVASRKRLTSQIKSLGRIRLALISGIFINNDRARTDLLIVGDDVGKKRLENFLSQIESELGKSIHYTLMDSDEYKYRMNMYDRFLRDILEFPHEKLINKVINA